jgi:hypothetical protein
MDGTEHLGKARHPVTEREDEVIGTVDENQRPEIVEVTLAAAGIFQFQGHALNRVEQHWLFPAVALLDSHGRGQPVEVEFTAQSDGDKVILVHDFSCNGLSGSIDRPRRIGTFP